MSARFHCPVCGAKAQAIEGHEPLRAHCAECETIFDPQRTALQRIAAADRERALVRKIHYTPDNLAVKRRAVAPSGSGYRHEALVRDDLEIEWRWNSGKHVGILAFAVLWNLFITIWYGFLLLADGPILMLLFGLPFVAVGLFMGYYGLVTRVNATRIELVGDRLRAIQGPLKWRAPKELVADEVVQLFTTKGEIYRQNDVPVYGYTVKAKLQNGRTFDLVPNMDTPEQALWVEQQIEDCLGLVDVAEPGELDELPPAH